MKERQRWRSEEDAVLRSYVKQYGPREWHLVPQRMSVPLRRDAKSCVERWKNYLKPGIKQESLTQEEQHLVILLQARHGNKWKRIAAEVPGRTAKRLGKWWEVFKEKQQRRERTERNRAATIPIDHGKYDRILENFAEKLVQDRPRVPPPLLMAAPLLPPWLSNSNSSRPPSPSVALTLSPSTVPAPPPMAWLQTERGPHYHFPLLVSELAECCREVEEGQMAWMAHKTEAAWRLRRVELQLETEKACKMREKVEEMEVRMRALREQQLVALERIEAEYRDQVSGLRRDAEAKEQKLAEQWAVRHRRLAKFLDHMRCRPWPSAEMNGR